MTRTPVFLEEPRSWRTSGSGISSIAPVIVRALGAAHARVVVAAARHARDAVGEDDLEDAGADEDAIALLEIRALDLLAVDEGAVRRAEVLDRDAAGRRTGCARGGARPCPRTRTI
jgi:hypothetical protein